MGNEKCFTCSCEDSGPDKEMSAEYLYEAALKGVARGRGKGGGIPPAKPKKLL